MAGLEITNKDIEVYGDDVRALIRAFAEKIVKSINYHTLINDYDEIKALTYIRDEINWILKYDL